METTVIHNTGLIASTKSMKSHLNLGLHYLKAGESQFPIIIKVHAPSTIVSATKLPFCGTGSLGQVMDIILSEIGINLWAKPQPSSHLELLKIGM